MKFGYGINYKYEGMLAHSFDRFYVVTKFILPRLDDLTLSPIKYVKECNYLYNLDDQNDDQVKQKEIYFLIVQNLDCIWYFIKSKLMPITKLHIKY